MKRLLLGTLAYAAVTFPLAVAWHVLLFEPQYRRFGYFDGEPDFLLGLITILIQGAVLSFLYPRIRFGGNPSARAFKYALTMGLFFWTSHVLAFVAKQTVDGMYQFILMESFYLVLQFGAFAFLLGIVYRSDD